MLFELRFSPEVNRRRLIVTFDNREAAESVLRDFAEENDLDVHIHPGLYFDSSISTAYAKGGDSLFDAVAVLRRPFATR